MKKAKHLKYCGLVAAEPVSDDGRLYDFTNERRIPISEEEYRQFIDILRSKKSIDDSGRRIDGQLKEITNRFKSDMED